MKIQQNPFSTNNLFQHWTWLTESTFYWFTYTMCWSIWFDITSTGCIYSHLEWNLTHLSSISIQNAVVVRIFGCIFEETRLKSHFISQNTRDSTWQQTWDMCDSLEHMKTWLADLEHSSSWDSFLGEDIQWLEILHQISCLRSFLNLNSYQVNVFLSSTL